MNFFSVLIFLLAGLRAAESSSQLTCNSNLLSNGSVHFQLSQGPSLPSCKTCWEDHNKTVIARDKSFDPKLVQSLRDDSITLADCRPLLYSLECSGVLQEIDCPVNCSHHVDLDLPSNPSKSTGSDKLVTIIIIITTVAAAAAASIIFAVLRCRPEAESQFGLWRTRGRLREVP